MAQSKLHLDTRTAKKNGSYPLKIAITHKRQTALISLDVYLKAEQWDGAHIVKHPQQAILNHLINSRKVEIDVKILELNASGEAKQMTASEIKNRVVLCEVNKASKVTFLSHFDSFVSKKSNGNTIASYEQTRLHVVAFDKKAEELEFEDITRDWLDRFEAYMQRAGLSVNTRAIHFRNLRAVCNDATDNGVTGYYAFRRYKIKTIQTAKRSLSVEQLRALISYPCEPELVQYRDMFLLSFYLVGINPADLFALTERNIRDGRIIYNRAKTGKLYDVKIEQEAQELLNKYKGERALLAGMDRNKNYRNYTARINEGLKRIGEVKRVGRGGRKVFTPLYEGLSMYWARHTWATIAAQIGVSKDTIAHALGHGGNTVTDIYIDFDRTKVDEANRAVIDYVIKGESKPHH